MILGACPGCHRAPPTAQQAGNQPGDVCFSDYTSAKFPYVQLMAQVATGLAGRQAAATASLLSKKRRYTIQAYFQRIKGEGKYSRPCIIFDRRGPRQVTKVCLMATFDSNDPQSLPELMRDVLIPVYPNIRVPREEIKGHNRPETDSKINITPLVPCMDQWSSVTQWVIALPIRPRCGHSQELPLWSSNLMPNGAHFSHQMTARLETVARRLRSAWDSRLMGDPEYLWTMYDEVRHSAGTVRSQDSDVSHGTPTSRSCGYSMLSSLRRSRLSVSSLPSIPESVPSNDVESVSCPDPGVVASRFNLETHLDIDPAMWPTLASASIMVMNAGKSSESKVDPHKGWETGIVDGANQCQWSPPRLRV
ncbi:hypothetical protein R3P38DRAFT_3346228 [Favolaschia claudopus]|uniref:Uncharacterized protein n=1 Tax=Favolaschia claudopus TaxID=2862362 RepID=A0AAW0D257_9AGAR